MQIVYLIIRASVPSSQRVDSAVTGPGGCSLKVPPGILVDR
jgi:hypothetical protein